MRVVNRLRRGLPLFAIVMTMPGGIVGVAGHSARVSARARHDFADSAANVLLRPADPRDTAAGSGAVVVSVATSSRSATLSGGSTTTPAPMPLTPTTSTTPMGTTSTSLRRPKVTQATRAPTQEATVVVASLGIDLPIVEGGQEVIDKGVVAHYRGPGWLTPTAAGAIGTHWLAAHEVTHGGPFHRLQSIPIGALVRVTTTAGQTFVYTVTSRQVVGTTATHATVYGTDPTARLILLQTCLDASHRLLVHGVLTAGRKRAPVALTAVRRSD
jgi:sortase (surface protein transpeptidase)